MGAVLNLPPEIRPAPEARRQLEARRRARNIVLGLLLAGLALLFYAITIARMG